MYDSQSPGINVQIFFHVAILITSVALWSRATHQQVVWNLKYEREQKRITTSQQQIKMLHAYLTNANLTRMITHDKTEYL